MQIQSLITSHMESKIDKPVPLMERQAETLSVISYTRGHTWMWIWLSGFCKDAHKLQGFMDFLVTRDLHCIYYLLFTIITFL